MGRSLGVPRHAGNAGSLPRKNPKELEKLPLHQSCSSQGHPWSITQGHLLESVLTLVSMRVMQHIQELGSSFANKAKPL